MIRLHRSLDCFLSLDSAKWQASTGEEPGGALTSYDGDAKELWNWPTRSVHEDVVFALQEDIGKQLASERGSIPSKSLLLLD